MMTMEKRIFIASSSSEKQQRVGKERCENAVELDRKQDREKEKENRNNVSVHEQIIQHVLHAAPLSSRE